jgi:ribosome maturation factor RimP
MEANDRRSLEAEITTLAEKEASSLGLEVVLVEVKGSGGRSVVRIYIDRQPSGVTLSDCEQFSKRFSVLLDVEDIVPFSYVLEVSSPGLDRPLVKDSDYARFTGKSARIRARVAVDGQKNFKGKILGVTNGRLGVELSTGKKVEIALADIEKANLVIEI